MKRKSVSSSMIASIGYDAKSSILEIEFNSGRIWHYSEVPKSVYKELIESDSTGRFFLENIKECYEEMKMK